MGRLNMSERWNPKLIPFLCCLVVWLTCQLSAHQGPIRRSPSSQVPPGEVLWLKANGLNLKTKIFRSARLSSHPVLIVVLHGDLLGVRSVPKTTYHYVFAQDVATKMDDVVVAALLRPGYRDDSGEQSEGQRGLTTGDNYTPEVVDAVAQVIDQLKTKFHPSHTILAGHSGGAAITGDLLGRWPSEVDAAFMVSCPCDLAAWRKHMMQMQDNNPIWSVPVTSLSPIELAGKVLPSVRVRLVVGGKDPVAPPGMSQRYAEVLREHHDDVALTIVPGLEHDILLEPATFEALKALLETLGKAAQPTKPPVN
jgi:pimeloyl-ACP methyl ester carboxylesterase